MQPPSTAAAAAGDGVSGEGEGREEPAKWWRGGVTLHKAIAAAVFAGIAVSIAKSLLPIATASRRPRQPVQGVTEGSAPDTSTDVATTKGSGADESITTASTTTIMKCSEAAP